MDLANPCLDFGMFTNQPEVMHDFYSGKLGLNFQGTTPMGPRFKPLALPAQRFGAQALARGRSAAAPCRRRL
jgi:hypothetical protein